MNLYHWEAPMPLSIEYEGHAFALASSLEEAIELVIKSYLSHRTSSLPGCKDFFTKQQIKLKDWLETNHPKVYNSPVGFALEY